jgi:hypothetical protein
VRRFLRVQARRRHLDSEVVELFREEPELLAVADALASLSDEEWRRAQRAAPMRSRRRVAVFAAAVVVVGSLAVAASAGGLLDRVVNYFRSPDAKQATVLDFRELERIRLFPSVVKLTGPARLVYTFHTPDGSYRLSAAPARNGFCWAITTLGVTCASSDSPTLEHGYTDIPPRGRRGPALIGGAVRVPVKRVVVRFEDGNSLDLPLVTVSPPIDGTFFLYDVPPSHWKRGTRPRSVVAYASNGRVAGIGWLLYEHAR